MDDTFIRNKIKRSLILLYALDAGGDADVLTPQDLERLGDGINWRLGVYDELLTAVRREIITLSDLPDAMSVLTIRRQVEDEIALYQDSINILAQQANGAEEFDQDEFTDRLVTLTLAIMILTLLIGSVSSESDLTPDEQLLVAAARLVLQSGAGDPRSEEHTSELQSH